ncbi:MAG TPA: biotin/lipoate--protein ligase family protein [Ferrovibrio sp.]|uniref:biotin/lipoate--protein ligase family protein n=1 Tax=Ferrovibrio sp. TaxID=1917215 RepID=UPI002ED4A8AF
MSLADRPSFPPGYVAQSCISDAFEGACRAAADEGAEDGRLLWRESGNRCEAAVVLRPLDPVEVALTLAYVAMLGLHDGLAAEVPPETPLSVDWPDRLLVNEACIGGIRIAHGPLVEKAGLADVPDWLVVGIAVQLAGGVDEDLPGIELEYTNLREEGCGDVTASALVEAFSRHLLHWIDRWQEEGFEPVRRAMGNVLRDRGINIEPNGDIWVQEGVVKTWRSLRETLRRPSWVLPPASGTAP